MVSYLIYPSLDEQYNFPPEVLRQIAAATQLTEKFALKGEGGGSGGIGSVTLENIPAGSTITVTRTTAGAWPVRPTNRADVIVIWKGPDPSPAIDGTGMLNNVDLRFVTP